MVAIGSWPERERCGVERWVATGKLSIEGAGESAGCVGRTESQRAEIASSWQVPDG
jgi:hypothetical protein